MDKDTGCKKCNKMPHTELCPIHRLEMISAQISYWTQCAVDTLEELKKEKQNELSSQTR